MRIGIFSEIIIYNPPFPSGVSRFFREITTELVRQGHEIFIFEPLANSSQARAESIKDGITVHRVFSMNAVFYRNLAIALPVKEIFFGIPHQLDIVHANAPGIALLAGMVSYRQRIPRIISYHTPLIHYTSYAPPPLFFLRFKTLVNYLERLMYNHFNLTIVPTQGVKNNLQERGFKGPFGFFPTCLDLQNLPKPSKQALEAFQQKYNLLNKKVILFVGRMSPEKGIEQVLHIAPRVIKKDPSAHFLMVGTGPYLEHYKNLIQEWNLTGNVTFTGYLSDFDLFTAMSISRMGLIFANQAQIFDMTILEYWNYGLPLIIRNAMGIDEIVKHQENGLLFSSLAEAKNQMISLLQNDNLQADLSENCKRNVYQNYDIRKCIVQLEELYAQGSTLYKKS